MDKIFEKNVRFHIKYCIKGKVQYLVFSIFFISFEKVFILAVGVGTMIHFCVV